MLSQLVRTGARACRAAPALQDALRQQTRSFGASSMRMYADAEIDLKKEQKREVSPKVQALADEFCSLTLLEVSDLTDILKERLGFSGMPMGMPMMGASAGAGAAPAAAGGAPAEAADAQPAKTEFDVKLDSFDAASKIKVIKEVRAATGLGLKEAKDLVEGAPAVVKKGLKKEEAEALKAKLTEAGAKVSVA